MFGDWREARARDRRTLTKGRGALRFGAYAAYP